MIKDKIDFPMHVNEWKETGGIMADYCRANAKPNKHALINSFLPPFHFHSFLFK